MSTPPSPAKVGHGVEEEGRGTGTSPVKVGRGGVDEEGRGTGTSPVKVGRGVDEEKGTDTTPVKVATNRVGEEMGKAPTPVNVKAEPGVESSLINIKVRSQTAADAFFRVKRDAKLQRLIDMYCDKHSLDPNAVRFLGPEGRHILPDQTPEEAGLEDGDAIDVFLTQTGGAGAPLHASQSSA